MKKLILFVLPFLFLACGEEESSTSVPLSPATTITASPTTYDFGEVKAGENKTASFNIKTDGYVSDDYNVGSVLGLDITDVKRALNEMYQRQTTSSNFKVTFTPLCSGNFNDKLFIATSVKGGASIDIPLTANVIDDTNTLPFCSNDNPVITVTSTPENIIKTGEITNLGTQKYINFGDIVDTNTVTIISTSDTVLDGARTITGKDNVFTADITTWVVQDNKVTSTAVITFHPEKCSGPASERFEINGLNETKETVYLYVIGTGTGTDVGACSNLFPLQTN